MKEVCKKCRARVELCPACKKCPSDPKGRGRHAWKRYRVVAQGRDGVGNRDVWQDVEQKCKHCDLVWFRGRVWYLADVPFVL